MFGKLGDMAGMLGKMREMQENMKKAQEELAETEVTGTSSCGRVEVVAACDMSVKKILIKPECLETADQEIVGSAVTEAVNSAIAAAKMKAAEKMSEITGGLNIPGLT